MSLDNKTILVAGACGLIGSELVRNLSVRGCKCVVADIDEGKAKELATDTDNPFVQMNIADESSVDRGIQEVFENEEKIDALINCAYPRTKDFGKDFFQVENKAFVENLNIHLGGFLNTCKKAAEIFEKQGYGNIINFASVYGVIPPRFEIYEGTNMTNSIEYAAIKAAIIHMGRFMAKRFKGMNIRVNTVSPGGILDGQPQPFLDNYNRMCSGKGMLDKEDLNGLIAFLLSDESKTINGQNFVIDDGFSL